MAGLISDSRAEFEANTDMFAGGYDGFFDAINPFDAFLSMPDVGAINGNDGAYTIGYVGGAATAFGVQIAASVFAPGLLQCGSLGKGIYTAWTIVDAAGAIATGVNNYNKGEFSGLDALSIGASLVGLNSLRNFNCFTGEVGVKCLMPFTAVAAMSSSDEETTTAGSWVFFVGIGFAVVATVAVRRIRRDEEEKIALSGDVFNDVINLHDPNRWVMPDFDRLARALALPVAAKENSPSGPVSGGVVIATTPPNAISMSTDSSSHRRRRSETRSSRRITAGLVGVIGMCLAGLCFWLGLPALVGEPSTQASLVSPAEPTITEYRESDVAIRDVEVSYALPHVRNPTGELDDSLGLTVDPPTWRKLTLKAAKPDGSHADVWLLRPLWWMEIYGAEVGETIELSIPEVGIDGPAKLLAIEPCPKVLQSANARIVTGKFVHYNAKVIDLQIAGEPDVIGTTANHPFWSEDRRLFIEAGNLKTGEKLRRLDGTLTHVVSAAPRPGLHTVYNLEVQVDHVYHVGQTGVLVHNTYTKSIDSPSAKNVHDRYVQQVRPGAKERVFDTPWSSKKGLGSRKYDDFDDLTKTAFEGNTTPWSRMNERQLYRKLDQVGSDFALLRNKRSGVNRVVWFGTEPLPDTGAAAHLKEALKQAGIEYWVVTP